MSRARKSATAMCGKVSALDFLGNLMGAAADNDVAELTRLLAEEGCCPNVHTPFDLRTPLHIAAGQGSLEACKLLVEQGAVMRPDRYGMLPSHDAQLGRHFATRAFLQDLGSERTVIARGSFDMALLTPNETTTTDVAVQLLEEIQMSVFQQVVRSGEFSYGLASKEVNYFFNKLGLHPKYYDHYTPVQIARHVKLLIAAKQIATLSQEDGVDFHLLNDDQGFFLTTLQDEKLFAMGNRVSTYLSDLMRKNEAFDDNTPHYGYSLTFMASDAPVYEGGKQEHKLALFCADAVKFDQPVDGGNDDQRLETDLQIIASRNFLRTKSKESQHLYQQLLDEVISTRSTVIKVLSGDKFPGAWKGGAVIQFATAETSGYRTYVVELLQCFRYAKAYPKRFYVETFANACVTYTLYFPKSTVEEASKVAETLQFVCHFKQSKGRSELVWDQVMRGNIAPSLAIYTMGLVKFTMAFFPKELYMTEYLDLRNELTNPDNRARLDELYKNTIREVLTAERVYETALKYLDTCRELFDLFESLAFGRKTLCEIAAGVDEIEARVENECDTREEVHIMRTMCLFNRALRLTNFYKKTPPSCVAFRFAGSVLLGSRPRALYPALPYGVYLVMGRGFYGFHCRFKKIARGGIRCIKSMDKTMYLRNASTLFEETYNLAYTQQQKNKDIPEGGSKGTILLDSDGTSQQARVDSFAKYIDGLLDCMLAKDLGIYSHLDDDELMFFGPDENTADVMDAGAMRARDRGYKYWKAATTGKSRSLGGVPHDVFGMTTNSVHQYVLGIVREFGLKEEELTKFQTGGPDGDLGSNEIKISKDKTISIVDGSGCAHDPAGLNRHELVRLANRRVPIEAFNPSLLGPGGFIVKVSQKDVTLPDGTHVTRGVEFRNQFHLSKYARADLFVPCGGRPGTINGSNIDKVIIAKKSNWKYIVEGANLFITEDSRKRLEDVGAVLFRDASANKGGVTSSSLEVLASLAMTEGDHSENMCVLDGRPAPPMYAAYALAILEIIKDNAALEFAAIERAKKVNPEAYRADLTAELSNRINNIFDACENRFELPRDRPLMELVLRRSVPSLLVDHVGMKQIVDRVPDAYLIAIVSMYISSRYVYKHGEEGEFGFFRFMSELQAEADSKA